MCLFSLSETIIQEIVPDATTRDIQNALSSANGDVAEAVENLLPGKT